MRTLNAEEISAVFGGTDTGLVPPPPPPGDPSWPFPFPDPRDPAPIDPEDLICW